MGKSKKKRNVLINDWIKSINEKCFVFHGETVYCNSCKKEISCERKSQLIQHLNTTVHKSNNKVQNHNLNTNSEDNNDENLFCYELCEAMVAVNMPWHALNNKIWSNFLKKYTNHKIPSESTLRKNYLEKCYNAKIEKIRNSIGENYVWISVDETTDSSGRYIANLIVGKMSEDEPAIPYLLACKQLEQTNHATIARFVNTSLLTLWPSGNGEKVLLLLTDAAAYMIKAGDYLKIFYPNMLHLTCLVHGLNRVAEQIRLHFQSVNKLISSVKKVFLKAPLRIESYKKKLGTVSLPPEPVITRWGTWLEAALFYSKHLVEIKEVIQSFDANEAISINTAQEVLKNEPTNDLVYIQTHFKYLVEIMKKLETRGMPLTESMDLITNTIKIMKKVPGECGKEINFKFDSVLKRNPGFITISKVNEILKGNNIEGPVEIPAQYWSKFKYAPITSCDVERSFSAYKMIFSDKRHKLTVVNLEKILVIYCDSNYN